jgi:hypothetical protein
VAGKGGQPGRGRRAASRPEHRAHHPAHLDWRQWLFTLAGYHLLLPRDHTLYFQTFGMVTFAGLVLAMRSHPPLRKCRFLISGFLLLTLFQLFLRLCNVWLAAFQIGWPAPVAQVVYHLCVYALPVILAAVLLIRDRCQILTKP